MQRKTDESKRKERPASIDEYLAGVPAGARRTLETLRRQIRAAAPAAVETISYGVPTFKHDGRPLVGFAAFAGHNSFFLMSTAAMDEFGPALQAYPTGKGTVRFSHATPLPAALVRDIVRWRIEELAREQSARQRPKKASSKT